MAQTGYTPIQLYYSTTAAAVPTNTNLANGELAINITDGKLYYKDNTGTVKLLTSTGSEISPITNNGVVYINGSGQATSGSALTFDGADINMQGSAGFTVLGIEPATTIGSSGTNFIHGINSTNIGFKISTVEQMRLTSTGLGIGTSSPSAKLSVTSGATGVQGLFSHSSGTPTIAIGNSTTTYNTQIGYNVTSEYGYIQATAAAGVYDDIAINPLGGNVGIGTTSPAYKLDVVGVINASAANPTGFNHALRTTGVTTGRSQIYLNNTSGDLVLGVEGSAGGSSYSGTAAYSSFVATNGANPFYVITNSAIRATLDSAGNLGLGVTPSAWGSDKRVLQFDNGASIYANKSVPAVYLGSNFYENSSGSPTYSTSTFASQYYQYNGQHVWRTAASGTAGNAISFTQAMTLDASGNLGVGTTSPAFRLDVQGPSQNNGDAVRNMVVLSTTSAGSGYGGGIGFGGYYNGTSSSINDFASIQGFKENSTAGDYAGALRFTTRANGGSPTERLRIASNGAWGLAGANYGSSGQVLTSQGSGSPPIWAAGGGGGSAATPTALGTVYGKTDASTLAFLGYQAGNSNTSGVQSVAIGTGALQSNVSNNYSTAVGYYALQTATADQNTAVGWYALQKSTTGGGNTAVGAYVMNSNLGGAQNTAVGFAALNSNTTGSANVAIGYQALYSNTTGGTNIGIGLGAGYGLRTNTLTPGQNIAIGNEALYSSSHAAYNIAIGYQALRGAGDNGGSSIAIGQQAGRVCATPASSIFIGNAAAYTATYWIGGTCVGTNAGFSYNDPGTPYPGNTFVGDGAGYKVSTGTGNTFLGGGGSGFSNGPGYNTTTGYQNTGMGTGALAANVTGGNSTGIGYVAFSNQTGGENTGLGSYAGVYNFGSGAATVGGNRNVFLGAYTIASGASDSNCIIIGTATVGKGSNTGFINPNSGGVYQGNNSSSWSTTSDQRLKKNIVDNTVGLSAINSIRVRNFEYRLEDEITELSKDCAIKKEGVQLGVIAQELQAVLPDCVKQETTGVLSVDPDNLTWYMVNAIKELNAKIEAQAAEIAILKGQA